jgi:hypothetical protein
MERSQSSELNEIKIEIEEDPICLLEKMSTLEDLTCLENMESMRDDQSEPSPPSEEDTSEDEEQHFPQREDFYENHPYAREFDANLRMQKSRDRMRKLQTSMGIYLLEIFKPETPFHEAKETLDSWCRILTNIIYDSYE